MVMNIRTRNEITTEKKNNNNNNKVSMNKRSEVKKDPKNYDCIPCLLLTYFFSTSAAAAGCFSTIFH